MRCARPVRATNAMPADIDLGAAGLVASGHVTMVAGNIVAARRLEVVLTEGDAVSATRDALGLVTEWGTSMVCVHKPLAQTLSMHLLETSNSIRMFDGHGSPI